MASETLIVFPPFRLDVLNEQLWRDTELVPVRPKPFAVLTYLATHAGRLVPRAELIKAVWPNTYVSEGVLRVYIREVRVVLGDDPETPRFIETVPRRGYRFLPAVTTTLPVIGSQQSVVSRGDNEPQAQSREPGAKILFQTSDAGRQTPDFSVPTPTLVGREQELTHLHRWLAKATEGTRQVVFVMGEPGIGKTTLVDTFLCGVQSRQEFGVRSHEEFGVQSAPSQTPHSEQPSTLAPWIARGQCIEHYGSGEAYLPVLEALSQLCRQ